MGKHKPEPTDEQSADALVKQGGKAEKRLLRLEREAERSLAEARAKLRKAQVRLERRLSAVSDAEALLRARQAARMAGPAGSNGTSDEPLPPPVATAPEPIVDVGNTADAEPVATLILPPSAKLPTRRRSTRSAAPKTQAS